MPPKQQPNKKSQEKMKAKIIEDKTFGLKNKKGAKQQKFIQQVQKQVTSKITQMNPRDIPGEDKISKKEEEKKKKEEIAQLFKPVAQTVAKGVDPKSVVCVYFKQNLCQKGDKCKFSHDLNIERKSEKRNIYEDTRENAGDTMENWDEQKLEDVVNKKHGEDNVKKNQTQIVCKYFIEAVENKTYGWFWQCPNGESCIYRHALPPGFTLKSDMKKKDDEEEVSMEMLVEKERASLGSKVTRVTLETFLAWKARKVQEKRDEFKKQDEKKRNDYKLGFMNGLTGRDIFTFNPDLITNDDEEAENDIDYRQREDEEEDELIGQPVSIRDLNAEFFASQAREVDGTGTQATDDRFSYIDSLLQRENQRLKEKQEAADAAAAAAAAEAEANEEDAEDDDENEAGEENDNDNDEDDENEDEEQAKASLKKLVNNNNNNKNNGKKNKNGDIEIDESLFNVEELQDLDEELEKLDI